MRGDMCSVIDDNDNNELSEQPLAYNDLSRRDVRSLVFHLLYAAESFDYQESLQSIVDNFNRGFNLNIPFESEVVNIAQAIIDSRDKLDELYKPLLANWRIERVSVVTKLILCFGIWELINTDTDSRIVINEAIELAKCFAEEGAYRFINGILDRIAKDHREKTSISAQTDEDLSQ